VKELKELTDEELVRYAVAKDKLTPLELELIMRLEDHLEWDYYVIPQWALELLDPDEEIPKLLN
jgi:hypothetical protein